MVAAAVRRPVWWGWRRRRGAPPPPPERPLQASLWPCPTVGPNRAVLASVGFRQSMMGWGWSLLAVLSVQVQFPPVECIELWKTSIVMEGPRTDGVGPTSKCLVVPEEARSAGAFSSPFSPLSPFSGFSVPFPAPFFGCFGTIGRTLTYAWVGGRSTMNACGGDPGVAYAWPWSCWSDTDVCWQRGEPTDPGGTGHTWRRAFSAVAVSTVGVYACGSQPPSNVMRHHRGSLNSLASWSGPGQASVERCGVYSQT